MIPALLVIVLSSTAFSEPTTTEPDWQAELLQRILRLVEPVHAADLIEGDARIEVQYPDSHSHVKCGTILTSEINASWARLSKETQVRLTRLFQRQEREAELVSHNGHFVVHYDTTGSSAVPPFDDDNSGIPDFAEFVAETFEDVWDR